VSVIHLREIPKGLHSDGSLLLDTTVTTDFLGFYLLKTIGWVLACALMASVALKAKNEMEPLIVAFNNKRVTPAVARYNSSQGAKPLT
jgi:hypothetical protein